MPKDTFDPSALFQTPYDAFRFDPLLNNSSELSGLSMGMHDGSENPLGTSPTSPSEEPGQSDQRPPLDRRSSSEEKENLTPAQSRRKAQNRAAQRAFRERKERHVKDLEAKLFALESSATSLASDNQRLKLALQRAKTENEILRASSGTGRRMRRELSPELIHRQQSPLSPRSHDILEEEQDEDLDGSEGVAYSAYRENDKMGGKKTDLGAMLSSAATWDFIVEHRLVKSGQVDITDVCERLKRAARCDGSGPVFAEKEVKRAIEESRRGGGDELL
jgi:hypothetical protein